MQNMCLQIKLLHRLHSAPDTPWARWTWRSLEGPAIAGKKMIDGLHWASVIKLMPVYHAISTIAIGDGQHTCFWTDDRLGGGTLQSRFPAIYSHVVKPDVSVTGMIRSRIRANLVWLTSLGGHELVQVAALLAPVQLNAGSDLRTLSRCRTRCSDLCVANLYKLCTYGYSGVEAPFALFFWDCFTPSRAKFFAWLLV
jgi:hypothetical protein